VWDYADLARLGHVTRALWCQIIELLLLAPPRGDSGIAGGHGGERSDNGAAVAGRRGCGGLGEATGDVRLNVRVCGDKP
jgi:hypothetical protein